MILQRSKQLHTDIQSDGCAYMSAAYFVNQYTNIDMTSESLNSVYDYCLKAGLMHPKAYMQDWRGVFAELGLNVDYLGHKPTTWEPKEGEIEILLYRYEPRNWWHFVPGDGTGRPTYDPWGSAGPGFRTSKTVALGVLHGKRGFKVKGIA